ncbi:MAG: TIGR03619 family F420-dependent LLM class oxidoreductase [Actinomycetota bacterium]
MAHRPQLSLTLVTFAAADPGGWGHLIARAEMADAAGVDRLAVSDHVAFGPSLDDYGDPARGGIRGGHQPTGPDGHWLEPLTVISHLSARTTRIRFGTNILLAALRRPVVLAKTAATIDVLSGGRLDLGVGVGWQAAEYAAAGLSFADRGAQLDHSLSVCRTLWSGNDVDFSDERLAFERVWQEPKPGGGAVPIWVSGTTNPRAMRRLARFGSGWIPWGPDAADLPAGIARMREAVAAHDRDPAGIGVVGSLPTVTLDDGTPDVTATVAAVPALVDAGVTDFRSNVRLGDDPAQAEQLAALVAAFRDAAD